VVAALAGLAGWTLERVRLGATDADSLARIKTELTHRFTVTADALASRAAWVSERRDAIQQARLDTGAMRDLFLALEARLLAEDTTPLGGITIFDAMGAPLAWAGRVSDLPRERVDGPAALFAFFDARGPRLVRVEPLADPAHPTAQRLATVVAEQPLDAVATGLAESFLLRTTVVDVAVRPGQSLPAARSPFTFAVSAESGEGLVEAEASPETLAAARARWGAGIRGVVLGILALTLLLSASVINGWRRPNHGLAEAGAAVAAVIALLVVSRALIWTASRPFIGPSLAAPLAMLPSGLMLALVVWLVLSLIERWRVRRPRSRLLRASTATWFRVGAAYVLAAAAATSLIWFYERALERVVEASALDLVRFSLHPLEAERLSMACGLVLLHAATAWAAAASLRLPAVVWRVQRTPSTRAAAISATALGAAATIVLLEQRPDPVPVLPALIALTVSGCLAAILSRPRGAARRASQSARLGAVFLALLLPAFAFYPSVTAFAAAARERRIAGDLAPLAARQREALQSSLPRALAAIDAVPSLAEFVTSSSEDAAPTTDRAFLVWSATELAQTRTTSAIELYGPSGSLVSWFALNLPEYGTTTFRGGSCEAWAPPYEETSPFGSSRRNVLRASRAICDGDRRVGAIVVRVMLDYRSLPFISAESPYLDSLRPDRAAVSEAALDRDVEFALYGWSRATIFSSATNVWPLADTVFDRMVASREPFWETVVRDAERFRVYFFNDRNGIYALGYPILSWGDHFISLGELVFLVGVLYCALLSAVTLFSTLASQAPASGRALLREVRSSFYRKLFIAFVASAVVPVLVLAVATQRYFTNQYRASVEDAAVKTATIAQRLVEDYAALQQRGAGALDLVDDQVMVLVRRAIDQDVSLFDRARLQATSERPLYASRLLPTRTSGSVYRSIVLDRLPTSVVVEDVGGVPYLLAAAPVRTGGRDGIVTVPQPLRSRDVEQRGDELDRRILSFSVLFVLLGSGLGYWMAERIADPVNRLTRATRRIARGDFDAHIAARSADEFRRLVQDFNGMADELKRQRRELERTQRLEAWAEMARQVAHDIKNPLTPIQLSAEHVRRVNIDRGAPLSPVVDDCVTAILSQVQLLRQISAEFSSFASSPTAKLESADLEALVRDVVEPYRAGLASRVTVVVDAARDVPEAEVDRTLLVRAMTNIIENALYAMPGGGTLTIRIGLDRTDADRPLLIEVADTGMGMDAEALGRLFEPYFSTKATGTGLGLTIAKRNVELIAGTITVDSTKGVGTTVRLRLRPARTAKEAPSQPTPPADRTGSEAS
jgi:signal transduction histidine kinase